MKFLDDIMFLGIENARSLAYVRALLNEGLAPAHIMLLNPRIKHTPGQNTQRRGEIVRLLEDANIPYQQLDTDDINSEEVLCGLKALPQKYVIYAGPGGAILVKAFFELGKKFLHVHSGRLPQFRGSTTVYYQILADRCCSATALFLNEKIDAGSVISSKDFPYPSENEDIDYQYDTRIRADLLVTVIKEYLREGGVFPELAQSGQDAETYYIMHPLLRHLAKLKCGVNAGT